MKSLWALVGSYTFVWGVWLANPFAMTFSPEAKLYENMAEFMPEWAWGLHAMILGACVVYGAVCKWPRGLMFGHYAGLYHWGLVTVLYALGDFSNTGALTSAFIAAFVHILWRKSKDTQLLHS